MARDIDDFAKFYKDQLASFIAHGGSKEFFSHFLWKTLLVEQNEAAANRRYLEEFRLPLHRLRAIERRSRGLLEDMELVNDVFFGNSFPDRYSSGAKAIAARAKEWQERLRPKRPIGRPTFPRRHFFVSGVLPYIKWKPVALRRKDQIRLWDWLSAWVDYIEALEVRDRKAFNKLPHRALYPEQVSNTLLCIDDRRSNAKSIAPGFRSWWQQSSMLGFHSVLAGSEVFLMWPEGRLSPKDRLKYAKTVCRVLKSRGISERELAGYPIGQVGAVLRTAPEHKKLAGLMRKDLPNLSAHAHKK